jgi:hypothetical protein
LEIQNGYDEEDEGARDCSQEGIKTTNTDKQQKKGFIDCSVLGTFLLTELGTYQEFIHKVNLNLSLIMKISFLNISYNNFICIPLTYKACT